MWDMWDMRCKYEIVGHGGERERVQDKRRGLLINRGRLGDM
jgi:hypothetical protein